MVLPAGEGGPAGTTGTFTVVDQIDDVLVKGNQVTPAITIFAVDDVYDVPFQFTASKLKWEGGAWRVFATDIAAWIQTLATHAHVTGIYGGQDTAPNGLLRDILVVTVGTDDGSTAVSVDIPLALWNSQTAYNMINQTWDTLVANQPSLGA